MSGLDVGLLAIRLAVGLTYFAHGAQKVLGWWEGPGFEKWHAGIAGRGLRPSRFWAGFAAANEFISGPLTVLGLLTPLASAFLFAQSLYITYRVHWPRGFFIGKGGIEFALQLVAATLLLVIAGAGALSLDSVIGIVFSTEIRVAFVVVAVAGALVAMFLPRFMPSTPQP